MAETQPSDEELYLLHRRRLVRLCGLLLADQIEGEEVAQEVFIKLFEARRNGLEAGEWGAWLTRVAVNACHDKRRSGWWKWWKIGGVELDASMPGADSAVPEARVAGLEQRQRIWQAFNRLSARQREIFLLRHVEGWSTAEVADALQLDSGTVKRHLFRAVNSMRTVLRGER